MRFPIQVAILALVTLTAGCGYFREEVQGTWDCEHGTWIAITIFPNRMILQTRNGELVAKGTWHGDSFWCTDSRSGESYEAAKVVPDDQMEVQAKAFTEGDATLVTCYKSWPSYADSVKMRQANPGPVVYPPPRGAITVGMNTYQLSILPWQPKTISSEYGNDTPKTYFYPSDDPNKAGLSVTVVDHHVSQVVGGNE